MCVGMHLTFFFSEHCHKIVIMLDAYKISAEKQYMQNNKGLPYTVLIFGQPYDLGFGAFLCLAL